MQWMHNPHLFFIFPIRSKMQIEFNGQMYKLETLASLVGFGRQEKVNTNELVIVEGSECDSKVPVCFVYDGKTYVLAGKVDTSKPVQVVCILTKHVLKKALMSVQSQPIDTYIEIPKATQGKPVQERSSVSPGDKAKAALARLSAGNEQSQAPRREQLVRKPGVMTEQTKVALRVLEATLSRKEESHEYSDSN